jgi:hypothetical protein
MTIEEIIRRYEPYPNKANINVIGKMMDEYAKQQSIAFAKFLNSNYWEQDDDGLWYKWAAYHKDVDEGKSDQFVYDLFTQSQNTKDNA